MNHHADFAALAEQRPEPACAHYCGGQCDPWGTGCAKRPTQPLHQIAEPQPMEDAGAMCEREDLRALVFMAVVCLSALGIVVLGSIFSGSQP